MSKHTPGPWIFNEWTMDEKERAHLVELGLKPVPLVNNDGARYIMQGARGSDIYSRVALVDSRIERKTRGKNATPYDAPDEERDANARLIAAAPDLLEALKVLLNETMYKDHPAQSQMAIDAIAKAESV